ncbi:hypothetical protein [Albibacterium indicum]|uniref:hypothetical protein n=1 Tax=Albibacterium indicum TaxID=2292082 RepID=UPI000E4E0303|nr:hypothetical protein [Pedobacter indicus]
MTENRTGDIPKLLEIKIFFDQKGFETHDAIAFFDEYSERNWKGRRGVWVKNWRAKALDWMWQRQRTRPYLRSKSKLMIL